MDKKNKIQNIEKNNFKLDAIILFVTFIFINILFLRRNSIYVIFILFLSIPYVLKKNLKVSLNKISILFFCFWIYYVFETLINSYRVINFMEDRGFYDLLFRCFLVFITFFQFSFNRQKVNDYFFELIKKFGFILCILGVIEFLKKKSLFYNITTVSAKDWQINQFGTSQFRVYTIFLHPIVYGTFLIILYWIAKNYKIKNYYIDKIFKLMIIINLYFTKSRSVYITFIVTLIIDYLLSHKKKIKDKSFAHTIRKCISVCFLLFFCYLFRQQLLFAFNLIFNRFKVVLDPNSMDGSRTQRIGAFFNIFKFIKSDIVGALFGRGVNYSVIFTAANPVNEGFNVVDNQYISIIYDAGIIGLAIFISIFFIIIKNMKKYYLTKSNKVCLIGILAIYINVFFYEGLGFYSILVMLSIFISMLNTHVKECS